MVFYLYEALLRLLINTSETELPIRIKEARLKRTDINGENKGNRKIALELLVNDTEFSNFVRTVIDEIPTL